MTDMLDENWRARELERFRTGHYKPVSFCKEHWFLYPAETIHHYAHQSRTDPLRVAYTPNEEYGKRDRQVSCTVGSYLNRFYSDILTENDRRQVVENLNGIIAAAEAELTLACSPDDIVRVYVNGPSSCMSHKRSDFDLPVHPTYIYGAGDLAVAYYQKPGGPITARCLVWPEKKVTGRFYGDVPRLAAILEREGYCTKRLGAFAGARMLRIDRYDRRGPEANGDRLIGPYLDWYDHCVDDGEFLYIGESVPGRKMFCQRTDGQIVGCREVWCSSCDCGVDEDNMQTSPNGDPMCESCFEDEVFFCSWCSEAAWSSDTNEVQVYCWDIKSGRYYWATNDFVCPSCFEDAEYCSEHDMAYSTDDCPLCFNERQDEQEEQEKQENEHDKGNTEEGQDRSNSSSQITLDNFTYTVIIAGAETPEQERGRSGDPCPVVDGLRAGPNADD